MNAPLNRRLYSGGGQTDRLAQSGFAIYGYCKSRLQPHFRKGLSGELQPRYAAVPIETFEFPRLGGGR